MSQPELMACLLCGFEGRGVKVSLVRVDQPEREVDVRLPATNAAKPAEMVVRVPERYFATPRCEDHSACLERQYRAGPGSGGQGTEPAQPEPVVEDWSASL